MRVVYLAAFAHSWSTETHLARDMARIPGVEVVKVTEPQDARPGFLADLETLCAGADLLVYQKTHGLPPTAVDVWRRIETRGCQTASYHLDLYVGLPREREIGVDPFWKTGTVFTADGDPRSAEVFKSKGVNHRWLPAAVVSDETEPGTYRAEYDHDVVFVGSERYHPQWKWRPELIGFLRKRYGPRFKLYGHHPPTRGRDLNDLYASARVVVGDSLALPGHTNYWSDRYPETLGRGGFLIAPWVPGIGAHFVDCLHFISYDPGETRGLAVLIDHALDNPAAMRKIADEGHAHVVANHTYEKRARQMLTELGLA
jgi:hypothetical protein